MTKFSISLPDELSKQLEAAANDKGETLSGVIAHALEKYFSSNGASSPPPPSPPQAPPVPSTTGDPQLATRVQQLEAANRDLAAKVADGASQIQELAKLFGSLDQRLSKLWHDVHDH